MKVALVQLNAGENKYKNINNACSLVISAAQKGASLIVLPEVFNYRGPLLDKKLYNDIAEDLPGESIIPLQKIAVEENTNILAGSIYERSKDKYRVYNTSVLIDNSGKLVKKYRKINLFRALINNQEIDESKTYKPGIKTALYKINQIKIGFSICFDLRFPELYRQYFKEGVDIVVVPSSFTSKTGKLHWEPLLRARAIENYCYVLAPNQFGKDGNNIDTYGHSMIISPQGEIINVFDKEEDGILISDLTFNKNPKYPSIN